MIPAASLIALLDMSLRPGREEADDYPAIVARLHWRVIECRAGLQWILQVRRGSRNGQPTWHGRRFHTDRGALLRSCRESAARGGSFTVGEIWEAGWRALEALPQRRPTAVLFQSKDRLSLKHHGRPATP